MSRDPLRLLLFSGWSGVGAFLGTPRIFSIVFPVERRLHATYLMALPMKNGFGKKSQGRHAWQAWETQC